MPESTPERRSAERRSAPRRAADGGRAGDGGRAADSGRRTVEQRVADHAEIDRLTGELLPALAAKLAATGLGEIEVREGPWKVRLRRPGTGPNLGRRATDKPSRSQPGHAGHGHAPGALEGHRAAAKGATPVTAAHSTNGSGPSAPAPVVAGEPTEAQDAGRRRGDEDPHRTVASSPAVGVFRPHKDVSGGTRVRAGDPVGIVDVLGVPQEVVAPVDGVVGATLVESGEAVEYGQDLVVIERITAPTAGGSAAAGS